MQGVGPNLIAYAGLRLARRSAALAAVLSLTLAAVTPCPAAETVPRGVSLSNYRVYSVTMDTKVKAPMVGPPCIDVRVWHALPSYKPWCQMKSPYGTLDYHAKPAAVLEAEADKLSTHILFDSKTGQRPGVEAHYVSNFRVVSPERRFDPAFCHVDWQDINRFNAETKVLFPPAGREITELAEKLKYNRSPIQAVVEYCKWIKDNMSYDAFCQTDGNDFSTMLQQRRGHCWHYMSILRGMCNVAGIQARPVTGLYLSCPSGNGSTGVWKSEFTNAHVWVEVYFPNVGWVEVEPNSEKCFNIPAGYIQNNTKFQNFAVWVTEQGRAPRMPNGINNGNSASNEYSVGHNITYIETRR